MKKSRLMGAVCACILAFLTTSANASIVYDSLSSGTSENWMNAMDENGTLISVSTNINPIDSAIFRIRNNLLSSWSSTINVSLYSNTDGLPGSLIDQGSTTFSLGAQSLMDVSVVLPNITVPSDPFWVVWNFTIENNATGVALGGTTTTGSNSDVWARNAGSGWTSQSFAFGQPGIKLHTSAVPLPAAAWLFGLGLLGLIGIARRKKAP